MGDANEATIEDIFEEWVWSDETKLCDLCGDGTIASAGTWCFDDVEAAFKAGWLAHIQHQEDQWANLRSKAWPGVEPSTKHNPVDKSLIDVV